ncbi:MAG: hypothetical protein MJY94_07100 [Bacteroidales bacterium]|nr:hypothetical protein [Bacteroidales bacterium]
MVDCIDIKSLNLDELIGVVNLYPWFGSARKELCLRMVELEGEEESGQRCAEAAMYIGSRRIIADALRGRRKNDLSDSEVGKLLKEASAPEKKVRAAGGDFFSQDEYDKVRSIEDNVFSRFASSVRSEKEKGGDEMLTAAFCTETLARIYIEQGYYEQALFIYRQLLLRYPEKSTYFASLIEKLEQIDNQIDRI